MNHFKGTAIFRIEAVMLKKQICMICRFQKLLLIYFLPICDHSHAGIKPKDPRHQDRALVCSWISFAFCIGAAVKAAVHCILHAVPETVHTVKLLFKPFSVHFHHCPFCMPDCR